MKASDVMTMGAATVRPNSPLLKAIEIMLSHRISALPVVDENGVLCGILTEGDVVRATEYLPASLFGMPTVARKKAFDGATVEKFMTVGAITIDGEADMSEAVALMKQRALKHVPVMSDHTVSGLLSRADLLRALVA